MKPFIPYSLGLVLLLAGGQAYAQQGFGTLETASEASIKAKAAAWLKEAGKTDPATMQRFETLWGQKDRTIMDRMGETFAIGNAAAAKLLAEARDSQALISTKVPALLTDKEQSAFFRANLGLAYVRILTNRRAYDEGLDVLRNFQAEQVAEPSAYLFHRAVCEHALLLKNDTSKTIDRLMTDALDAPERYRTVSHLMLLDMYTWQDKDLGAVSRTMKRVEERLDQAKAGKGTQDLQKQIVRRLDELIKEKENKSKKKDGPPGPPKDGPPGPPGDGPPNDGECPDGETPGDAPGSSQPQNKPSQPLPESKLMPGKGDGKVDQAKLKKLVENWGSLPARERELELNRLTVGMSPSHRQAIENYFRNIALDLDVAPRK